MKRTFEDIREIINNLSCEILGNDLLIRFENHPDTERMFVQVGAKRKCAYTGEMGEGFGGKYEVSVFSTEDEIVKKVLSGCLAYAEHEIREGFLYKGKRLFNPHMKIDTLMGICEDTVSRETETK